MPWVRVDDEIAHHPKLIQAGPLAGWLYICGLCYCNRYLTDGFIPHEALRTLGVTNVTKWATRLSLAGLWDAVDGGFRVHDYLSYQTSAAEVKADREWDRRRKELYADPKLVAAIKQRDLNRCRYCAVLVSWTDRRGRTGGQFDHVVPRGPNTLENVVVACRGCNISKNGRTPEEAGMALIPVSELAIIQSRTSSESIPSAGAHARALGCASSLGLSASSGEKGFGEKPKPDRGAVFADDRLRIPDFLDRDLARMHPTFDRAGFYLKLSQELGDTPMNQSDIGAFCAWVKDEFCKAAGLEPPTVRARKALSTRVPVEAVSHDRATRLAMQHFDAHGCQHEPAHDSRGRCIAVLYQEFQSGERKAS